ncbi:MAG: polysaccharide biosynthesis/export family protein [Phycisphaerae bacterium]
MGGSSTFVRRAAACVLAFPAGLCGCAALPPNSFLDPTQVGQFPLEFKDSAIRRVLTPRDTPPGLANATEPTAEDLVPELSDYRVGPLDQLRIQINDLLVQSVPFEADLEVSPAGYVRIPDLGSVRVTDLTEEEIENEIKTRAKETGVLPNPVVQVTVLLKRQQFFTIIGSVAAAGPYQLTQPDLRLLDAIGLARDIGPEVKRLYVIRRSNTNQGGVRAPQPSVPTQPPRKNDLVIPPPGEEGLSGSSRSFSAPAVLASGSQQSRPADRMEMDDLLRPTQSQPTQSAPTHKREFEPLILDPKTGQNVGAAPPPSSREIPPRAPDKPSANPEPTSVFPWDEVPEYEAAQRVIEIDVTSLRSGDPRYNIAVRNRDVIMVPQDIGVFYAMGEVNRPGVYSFNGREITIKQAVAIFGGLSTLAWPQRVEIVRREQGTDKQITIPVNLDAIFAGLEPDLLLRDEDIVNVGSSTLAPFLFVIRNSFRFTYGFGFVYDRNFADQDSYGAKSNPETRRDLRRQQRGLPF